MNKYDLVKAVGDALWRYKYSPAARAQELIFKTPAADIKPEAPQDEK